MSDQAPNRFPTTSLFKEDTNLIWPISRFELHRNILHHPFPHKMEKREKEELLSSMISTLDNTSLFSQPITLAAGSLTPQEKQDLYQQFLIAEDLCETKPQSAFYLDDKAHYLLSLQMEDHIVLRTLDSSTSWAATMESLTKFDKALHDQFTFSYDRSLGYLTSDKRYCGTGFVISCYLHLPCLCMSRFAGELSQAITPFCEITGLDGANFLGDICIVSNKFCIGISEEQILEAVHKTCSQLQHLELLKRSTPEMQLQMKDRISRAFGLGKHSYEISYPEAISHISLLLLGVEQGWIEGLPVADILTLFFDVRKGYFQALSKENGEGDLPRKLAQKIQLHLKDVQIKL